VHAGNIQDGDALQWDVAEVQGDTITLQNTWEKIARGVYVQYAVYLNENDYTVNESINQ